jgi:pimeloyl-ACP methyl ester carboxylesterase
MQFLVREFRGAGFNVLMPDYPGYGMSGGSPSEKGFYGAADAAYDYLTVRRGIGPGRVIAAGWSMGAGVATDLAARRPVAGLAVFSAFTSLPAVAHALAPWAPTSLIIRSRFDNLAKFPGIRCPIFIAHGTLDELVPAPMSATLRQAAGSPVTLFWVKGAGHNEVFSIGGPQLLAAFGAWAAALPGAGGR